MPGPRINHVNVSREELTFKYREMLLKNPLLGRVEGTAKNINWTDLEIRTLQLITAVASNASMSDRIRELEQALEGK